jgi:tRNA(Ile)-lysidine synthase
MNNVLAGVRRTIRNHRLFPADARVAAAVSGGSDSTALAYLLRDLHAAGEVTLAGIAHFNHQLRTSASDDESFVAQIATAIGIPFLAGTEDVTARARREHRSIEDAARAARYEFFDRARAHFGADRIALGHTRDDQAETFLLRLIRGAGPRGLASMHPRHGAIVRPLLDCRRHELRAWLSDRAIAWRDDETNADVNIPRNRVRAELIPLLASRFNASIVDVLAGEAELAGEAWDALGAAADETAARIVKATDDGCEIDREAFLALPIAVRRTLLWREMCRIAGGRTVGFEHVAQALRMLEPDGASSLDAPGHRLERIGERVVLRGRVPGVTGRVERQPPTNLFRYSLSIPGVVQLSELGCVVSAESVETAQRQSGSSAVSGNSSVAVRRDLCGKSLAVRNRRPGDRFRPAGLGGTKKLQDFFVDRKVARSERDRVPLVVDDSDRIVWVAGFGIDEAFRITDPGQAMLILRLSAGSRPR